VAFDLASTMVSDFTADFFDMFFISDVELLVARIDDAFLASTLVAFFEELTLTALVLLT